MDFKQILSVKRKEKREKIRTFPGLSSLCLSLLFLVWIPLFAQYTPAAVTDNVVLYTTQQNKTDFSGMLATLNQRIDALQMSTGVYLNTRADIYVLPNRASYQQLAGGKESIVEFSDAFYSSGERRIYIRSREQIHSSYTNILMHEYVHWYLDQIFLSTPLWFHEGLATEFGTPLGVGRYLMFIRERFWGNRLDLFELAYRYPRERRNWELYYLSSYFAVKYMQERDEQAWRDFWTLTARNQRQGVKTRFTEALSSAYRLSLYQFNLDFSRHTRKLAYQYLIIGVNSIIFSLLPFVLLIAVLKHRRRLKALPDLPEPEEPEPPEAANSDPGP